MIVLAWLFVLTRIVHAAIHIGPNKVRWRSPAFALGLLIVAVDVDQAVPARAVGGAGLSRCGPAHTSQAAVEVLDEILSRHRPAATALADWGKSHRFAGSGDRAAIGNLVYDALRRRRSLAAQMGSDTPARPGAGRRAARARPVGRGRHRRRRRLAACAGAAERGRAGRPCRAPFPPIRPPTSLGDFPDWLAPSFERASAPAAAEEGAALAQRAPVDCAPTRSRPTASKVLKALARFSAEPTPLLAARRAPAARPKAPAASPTSRPRPAHGKGWYEVQDEGSQIAALMAGAGPRQQVLDICAGAGGKTLAHGGGHAQHRPDLRLRRRPACGCGRSSSG